MFNNSIIKIKKEILSSNLGDEVVLMSLESDAYINLNSVGSRVWELIKTNKFTYDDLIKQLLKEYEIEKITCEQETTLFLKDLINKNLIETNPV